MATRAHRITLAVVAGLLWAGPGCTNKQELQAAQHSVYDADFATVYTQVMQAVQKLYPSFQEDAAKGFIQTGWSRVNYAASGGDDAARGTYAGAGMTPTGATVNPTTGTGMGTQMTSNAALMTKRYFIRFDVRVVGGRPWRVHVVGHASEWEPGNAEPTELHGGNKPPWLDGRTDELLVAIYERLQPYAKPSKDEDAPAAPDEKPIDTTVFGAIPPDAAKAAAAVERAVERRDYAALRAAVADDVVWNLGAEPGADAALATWQADPTTLDALVAALKAGCDGDAKQVVCPKAAAPGAWKATLAPRGAAWKLASFVQGE